ncbi:MAG: hypothetical protein RJA70_3798, partial [Pseudomonadota bacterium]
MKLNLPSFSSLKKGLALTALVVSAGSTSACLQRPVCGEGPNGNSCEPKTTNVLVTPFKQNAVDKIDMLFVIDNSASMADKTAILKEALPDLVKRFVSPICIDNNGAQTTHPPTATEACPPGSAREFEPIKDIHIGVVTSSLGGYGSTAICTPDPTVNHSEQNVDMARLLGSLPRGAAVTGGEDFLNWKGTGLGEFTDKFKNLVGEAGENGCGFEATLESWYRFLVDPYPYEAFVKLPCIEQEGECLQPTTALDAEGKPAPILDKVILQQRAAFLRPDSLVAIIMLSDENDCSFKASGQSWRMTLNPELRGAPKASAKCEEDPNDPCCQTCIFAPAKGCPTGMSASGKSVAVGCEESTSYPLQSEEDPSNLRCFAQKRRFGHDFLYPVERYSRALTAPVICPSADNLDPVRCAEGDRVNNPLFVDLSLEARKVADPAAVSKPPRPASLVFLAGIVGVPWQDVAISAKDTDALVYRSAKPSASSAEQINWDWLLGPPSANGIQQPQDPLMIEQIEPRNGVNPATQQALAGPEAGLLANAINGHEWNVAQKRDLQYACIFELKEHKICPEMSPMGAGFPNCDCSTDSGGNNPPGANNPLCQADATTYDLTQRYAKAYPSQRQLQVLKDFGANAIVASICPKETVVTEAPDYGYRPAVAAIVERLKEQLADKCLPRGLAVKDGAASCKIVEATSETAPCDPAKARREVDPGVATEVRKSLEASNQCGDDPGQAPCESFRLCEIKQVLEAEDKAGWESCLNNPDGSSASGWCYIDPGKGLGSEALVEKCPDTEKRKLRFVNFGKPANGSTTVFACSGESFVEAQPLSTAA